MRGYLACIETTRKILTFMVALVKRRQLVPRQLDQKIRWLEIVLLTTTAEHQFLHEQPFTSGVRTSHRAAATRTVGAMEGYLVLSISAGLARYQ